MTTNLIERMTGALIVKDLIDGSGAEECKQIQAGDTLTQVEQVQVLDIQLIGLAVIGLDLIAGRRCEDQQS